MKLDYVQILQFRNFICIKLLKLVKLQILKRKTKLKSDLIATVVNFI